jgi:hypothetical protein
MEEQRFAAGNVAIIVSRLETQSNSGVSVDVLGTEMGRELSILRLDWSQERPHYHYNPGGGEKSKTVALDPALIEDSLDWFLERMPERLSSMVRSAGHPDVAKDIDPAQLARALPEVKRAARHIADVVAQEKSRPA